MSDPSAMPARKSHPKSGPFAEFAVKATPSFDRLTASPAATGIPVATARERARSAASFLAKDQRVHLVYLFGSTAAADRATVGDVDLGILTRPALTLRELVALQVEVTSSVGSGIDLVVLNEASIVLAWEVVKHGECLYAADPDEELEFVIRSQRAYWDFKPFLETQYRLTGLRLEERLQRGSQA